MYSPANVVEIENIADVKKIISDGNWKIFGIGGTPITRTEIHSFVSDFESICSVSSGELTSVQKKLKATCFELKDEKGNVVKKPGKIISDPRVIKHIKKNSANKKIAILVMKPTDEILKVCDDNRWVLLGNNFVKVERYNDKNKFQDILRCINFSTSALSIKFDDLTRSADDIFEKLGDNIVVQLPKRGGGQGTFFFNVKEKKEMHSIISKRIKILQENVSQNTLVVVNSFFQGPSLSSLGTITKENKILSYDPQYQLIDIKEVIKNKVDASGVFCGHDWSLSNNIPQQIRDQAHKTTKLIGNELKKDGLLGIFGVDYVWDKKRNKLIPIEINTRITGTFPTIIYVQLAKKEIPLIAFHVLDFLDISYSIKKEGIYNKRGCRRGAHLILFNNQKNSVVCEKEIIGGVYSLSGGVAEFKGCGFEMEDIKKRGEFVITDGVPTKTIVYGRNRKVAKIITKQAICKDPYELNNWGKEIVKATYNLFNFKRTENKK